MRLLGQLEGVSPTTYPKHPITILMRLCLRHGHALKFAVVDGVDTERGTLLFRGRGRIRGVWLSSIVAAPTRRTVRTRIAEEARPSRFCRVLTCIGPSAALRAACCARQPRCACADPAAAAPPPTLVGGGRDWRGGLHEPATCSDVARGPS